MKTIKLLVAGLLAMALALPQASSAAPGAGAERARVYVVYKDGQRGNAARALAMAGAEVHYDFAGLRGYAVSVPAAALEGLTRNPAIEFVEEDARRYLMAETVPYGIIAVQANLVAAATATGNTQVCIIDSGYTSGHEDLPSSNVTGHNDPGGSGNWYEDQNGHGTHVAGTVAAVGGNAKGVVGVLPSVAASGSSVSLFIVKVFGAEGWTYSSSLVDALNKCTGNPVRGGRNLVVSMSLGGSIKSRVEDSAFASAHGTGKVLSIAAAGNDGNSRNSYPASYSSVVSVAAIDESRNWATFSQYNSQVELSAPGVAVLSTVPTGTGTSATVTVGGVTPDPEADAMDGSWRGGGSGALVDCGIGDTTCVDASGKVCLIQRGTVSFADKVLNCQAGGGVAAIIYNNVDGPLLGTLGGVATSIPSVGVSSTDGSRLLGKLGASASVSVVAGDYAKFDGTSMATPHVAAVAALVWSNYPSCTNAQLRNVLDTTALDLGAVGRDVYFGFGLVQAKAALDQIAANGCGSAGGGGGKGGGKKP
ncbi:MAG: S8 family serine peptidase [Steroidobacteraceae bacterium]